jgi:hypothetical protein
MNNPSKKKEGCRFVQKTPLDSVLSPGANPVEEEEKLF